MKQLFALIALSLFCSCAAGPAAIRVDRERATECVEHCASLDMKLSAMVVIANQCGCVCEPATGGSTSTEVSGAATAGGGMAIVLAAQAASNNNRQQQSSKRR